MSIQELSDLELIIELFHDGKAEIIPKAVDFEPIAIDSLIFELSSRVKLPSLDKDQIKELFLGSNSPLCSADLESLKGIVEFKYKTDALISKIKNR